MNETYVDILVIGAGPAGLAAAQAARESGIENLLVLERENEPGGILRQCIHNGFGLHRFREELTGPEYAQRDIDAVRAMGIPVECGCTVLSVSPERVVTCVSRTKGFRVFRAGAVILAMGCRERPRGALCTPGTRCAGIYSAGTAQRFVNLEGYMPGRRVVILGSGDIGLIMARRMTLQGAKVLACVEIMPYSSGLNRNIVQCLEDYGIPLLLSHTVTDIRGRDRLEGITVSKVDENRNPVPGTEIDYECDTLLLSCGLIPENELSAGAGVRMSPATSGPMVSESFETSVDGIFACGNVLHVHDLVDHVSAESLKAGHAAAEYIRGNRPGGETIPVCDGEGVRGTVPQSIRKGAAGPVDLMFRPSGVFRNASAVVENDGREILRKKAMIFTPGEMSVVTLKEENIRSLTSGKLTVRIERS
ncbi:MAG: NAD(P)/FAD-dependent oxidoreductase [Clostridiales bacterium]|nr:NAD(P)/FAD-dependent oxidoreductase [Clostridiales bacterium]